MLAGAGGPDFSVAPALLTHRPAVTPRRLHGDVGKAARRGGWGLLGLNKEKKKDRSDLNTFGDKVELRKGERKAKEK